MEHIGPTAYCSPSLGPILQHLECIVRGPVGPRPCRWPRVGVVIGTVGREPVRPCGSSTGIRVNRARARERERDKGVSMRMCVYVYVCVCMCMCVHVCAYVCLCLGVCVCACVFVSKYASSVCKRDVCFMGGVPQCRPPQRLHARGGQQCPRVLIEHNSSGLVGPPRWAALRGLA